MINFEKDNYWAKMNHTNYNIPLKICETKDYQISLQGKYPIKYTYCDIYIGGELPKDDGKYIQIKLQISMNEHKGVEYYSVIESIGFGNSLQPTFSYVKIYKMPPNVDTIKQISNI